MILLNNDYWLRSQRLASSLLFVGPLWLLYQVLAYQLNHGFGGNFRTGIDILFAASLRQVGISSAIAAGIPAVLAVLYLLPSKHRASVSEIRLRDFGFILLESLIYALIFGLCVGKLTELLLSIAGIEFDGEKVAGLVVNLGSGVYEEFLFRVVLLSGIVYFLQRVNAVRQIWPRYVVAILLTSILFAAFHYLKIFGEAVTLESFLFRFFAGLVFSLMFICRGYGVTAYAHSFYNVFLMLR
ncbi:CPBP family intramembrane metalloprotease [candidate division KSB1 bacterium]|nr:CPBP family intramembrane metalloprotease [candidate division KSB1 bacterium]